MIKILIFNLIIFLISIIISIFIHELGHYLVAKYLKCKVNFKFVENGFKIPTFVVFFEYNKNIDIKKQSKLIGIAGFSSQLILLLILLILKIFLPISNFYIIGHLLIIVIHFSTYPFINRKYSDLDLICNHDKNN